MMKLYRYISTKRFNEMIESKKLYFANPFLDWEDKKEGYLIRYLENTKEWPEYIREPYKQIIINIPNLIRCQSWCKAYNDKQMWEEYGDGCEGVMIETTWNKLGALYYNKHKVESMEVEYIDSKSIPIEIDSDGKYKTRDSNKSKVEVSNEIVRVVDSKNGITYIAECLRKKSEEFSFENEVRAYTVNDDINNKSGIFVTIPIISNFINKVVPNPKAGEKYKTQIKEICNKNKIEFKNEENYMN